MDIEKLRARVIQLRSEREMALSQIDALESAKQKMAANVNAYNGAIAELDRLICEIEVDPAVKPA